MAQHAEALQFVISLPIKPQNVWIICYVTTKTTPKVRGECTSSTNQVIGQKEDDVWRFRGAHHDHRCLQRNGGEQPARDAPDGVIIDKT